MTPVLVTGGAGYIGSHACKALAKAGYLPITFDNLSRGHRDLVKWGPFEEGDVGDTDRVIQAIEAHGISSVMHFAAFAYVGESMEHPAIYMQNNVANGASLLEACRHTNVGSLVISSTCAVYGQPEAMPITEATVPRPINIYGVSKLMLEEAVNGYARSFGLNAVALRYFNACGADPDLETGEHHEPEPHLIPRALLAAAGVIPHLDVLGTDFDTRDGTCVRDFIHVTDLANAHVGALRRLHAMSNERGRFEFYNLGSANGYTVREIADAAARVVGSEPTLVSCPRRPGDPACLIADSAMAREVLGFETAYTDLDEMLTTAWAWMRKRGISKA